MQAERLPQNRIPANQAALVRLREVADWSPDPRRLYLLQLAELAIEERAPDNVVPTWARHRLEAAVAALSTQPAGKVVRFLAAPQGADPLDEMAALEQAVRQAPTPVAAGQAVLEHLATRFQAVAPSLSQPSPM